jgi:hypothetical protein
MREPGEEAVMGAEGVAGVMVEQVNVIEEGSIDVMLAVGGGGGRERVSVCGEGGGRNAFISRRIRMDAWRRRDYSSGRSPGPCTEVGGGVAEVRKEGRR